MKSLIKWVQTSAILFSILQVHAQDSLKVVWGLEGTQYHKETISTDEEASTTKKRKRKYRNFISTVPYEPVLAEFFKRHQQVWQNFKKNYNGNLPKTKEEFSQFAIDNDPYLVSIAKKMAPQLYFDFIGNNKEYILESITITTINFGEYKGGGFSSNEAWYDIELKHRIGKHTYLIDKKLKFTGSGRAVLRFWSDNYYSSHGLTPSGEYTINIKFNFIVDGKKVGVSTGVFKIDV